MSGGSFGGGWQGGVGSMPGRRPGATPAPGLVSLETSIRGIQIDRVQTRLNRMQAAVRTASRLIQSEVAEVAAIENRQYVCRMLTLTYRPGEEWEPGHVTECVKDYQKWAEKEGFKLRYVWVAEIQANRYKNGALLGECVHYHLLIWSPMRLEFPKADKAGFWVHGMTQTVVARKPVKYITKYATKGHDVFFPKGLRTHASGGLSMQSRRERTWWMMPRWVRVLFPESDMPRRKPGGGIILRATGRVLDSIWSVLVDAGKVYCWLRDDIRKILSREELYLLACDGLIQMQPDFDIQSDIDALWDAKGSCECF